LMTAVGPPDCPTTQLPLPILRSPSLKTLKLVVTVFKTTKVISRQNFINK